MKKFAFILGLVLMLMPVAQAQLNMTFLGNYTYGPDLSDIWGHVDSLGNEYAIVGVLNGVSVVDVTNPTTPSEVYFISAANTIWRDIKVWNNHAYITNEASGGLKIIDLSNLPDPSFPTTTNFTGSTYPFSSAHDIYIDENGIAYILGSDNGNGGAIILDLNVDPMNPVELGRFNTYYLHDAMVRGDTLWGAAINNGFFVVVDVSNKGAPSVLATQNTPSNFTHNCWISDDGNTLFTTDETSSAYLTAYDVSDVFNISELDRVQSNPGTGTIPHNTHVINDFIVTSYYRDGVTVHDVTRPANIIQTGFYDTYTAGSGNGFNGAWGVYPWLPSGNVIVSDIEGGLFILGSTYTKGCYLEGTVTDFNTSNPITNATIEILVGIETTSTDASGNYAMAILTAGTYNVVFSAPGYTSDTLSAVLSNGVLTILDVQLVAPTPFVFSGQVIEASGGSPIVSAEVLIANSDFQFLVTTDGSGNFSISNFFSGTYDIIVGKWLYKTSCSSQFIDSSTAAIVIQLDSGLYDDFTFDFGWGITGNASTGIWVREEPIGTNYAGVGDANPEVDVSIDCHDRAYITGNGGGSAGNDDVDNGNTIVKSPIFDLTSYTEPYVKYHRWFFNDGGGGTPNDTLSVVLSNGATTAVLEAVHQGSAGNSTWISQSFKISDYILPTSTMQLLFETSDFAGSGHLVEAGVDLFQIEDYSASALGFNASCNGICDAGAIAQVTGGVAPLTYLWNDPASQTTDTALALCAGTYTVTITDAVGDITTAQVTVSQPIAITLSITTLALCSPSLSDVTVTASNGVTPYTYMWSDAGNQTTQTATSLSTGTYTVTVTDANGCTDSSTVTTPANTTVSVATSGTDPTVCGSSDGTATASASNGSTPYSYSWNDAMTQTSAVATGLSSGTYTVIVTDASGCSDTGTVVLTASGAPILSINNTIMPSCHGLNDGSVNVYASGVAGPFSYTWNTTPVQTDSTATGLIAGTYSVDVSAGGICTSSVSVTISEPDTLITSVGTTDILCFGDQTGMAIVIGSGGTVPYSYLWSTGQNGQTLNSLFSGTYAVSFTDGNGCVSAFDSFTINEPAILSTTTIITDVVCVDDSNGAIDLTPSGGVAPYSFSWSHGSTMEDVSGLEAGTYILVLNDSNACSLVENVSVGTQSSGAQAGAIIGSVVVSQNSSEFYAVAPNSGSVYNWIITGGTQIAGDTANSITVQWNSVGTGQVAVVETDSLGCTGDTVVLNVSIATSLNELNEFQMKVLIYPNHSSGQFVVEMQLYQSATLLIELFNTTGERIYFNGIDNVKKTYTVQIDLRSQAKGLYYIQIVTDRTVVSRKIIYQ